MIPYGIGTTAANIVSLQSLGINPPRASVPEYTSYVEIGSGIKKGIGWLVDTWRFHWISQAGITALRVYIATKSASIFIRTLNENGTYSVYSAIAHWPDKQPPTVGDINDFVLTFTNMEAA